MFYQHSPEEYKPTLPGIRMKTMVYGEKTLMVEVHLQKGSELPLHKHPHEQTGYLVSGCLNLSIEEETNKMEAGDSWSVPGDVEHSAVALEDSVAIEVFSPVREDYLVYLPKAVRKA